MTELMSSAGPCQVPTPLLRNRHGDGTGTRLLFVAGLRGDDLEGVKALGLLHQRLNALSARDGALIGTCDLYPVLHPNGVDGLGHAPGRKDPSPPDATVAALLAEARGARLCVHLTRAEGGMDATPLVTVSHAFRALTVPLAEAAGVELVWVRRRHEEGSLAARLEEAGVPTLTLTLPSAALQRGADREVLRGLLSLAQEAGALRGVAPGAEEPAALVVGDGDVHRVFAEHTGIFIPSARAEPDVWEGDRLGAVLCPLTGAILAEIPAPVHGVAMARRAAGMVRPGVEIARIAAFPEI